MDFTQDGMAFWGPKNKKQIGTIGKAEKIYIEDYAVTYLNQIARNKDTKNGVAGLFGNCREIDGVKEYYIYAAAYQEGCNVFENGLPRETVQKIMRKKAEEFTDYLFLGWAFIYKENMGTMWESCYQTRLETLMGKPELLMTLRCETCEEHFYLYPTEMPKEAQGYFIFYEQNDAMQNHLIDWHGANHMDRCDSENDSVAESCRNFYKERKRRRFRTRMAGALLTVAAFMLVFGLGFGIQNLNHYHDMQEVGQTMGDVEILSAVPEGEFDIQADLQNEQNAENDVNVNEFANNETPDGEISGNETPEDEVITEGIETEELTEMTIDIANSEAVYADAIEDADEIVQVADGLEQEAISNNAMDVLTGEAEKVEEIQEPVKEEAETSEESLETINEIEYQTYEISRGDTLYGICVKFYGNVQRAQEVCQLNNIENMDNILYGQKILLPK